MDTNVLKSYLVSLGFKVDTQQLAKFEGALKSVANNVDSWELKLAADTLKWQAILTGAFVAVSTAVVGMADHVAMADQKYRLLGLSMFMTKESARKLSIGMDALGASMEEIAWDPEINRRFLQLSQDQDEMAKSLGTDFDANMRSIRDLRFEFTRLHVAIQYLGMEFVNKLFEKFGMTMGDVHAKVEKFITWFQQHIPEIADELATDFVPILKDTWNIVLQLGEVLGGLATIFTNLVGLFSGDKSIEGTEFSFHKLAGAIEHVVKWVSTMLLTLTQAEQMLVHFANAVSQLMSGNFSAAKDELLAGLHSGMQALGPTTGAIVGGAIGTMILPGIGTGWGMMAGAYAGGLNQVFNPSGDPATPELHLPGDEQTGRAVSGPIADMLAAAAARRGVDPRLVAAVAQQESGSRQFKADGSIVGSSKGAQGVMQLMPKTAQQYGVDPADTGQNIQGGVAMLADMLKRYHGNTAQALAAYNWGPGNLDNAIARHGRMPAETENYVSRIMSAETGQTVTVGDVYVSIMQPGASAAEIGAHVQRGLTDAMSKQQRQTQRNNAQLAYSG
jgi:hypothetical protein